MGNIRTCRTNGFNILKERLLVLGENYKKLLVKYNCYGLGGGGHKYEIMRTNVF